MKQTTKTKPRAKSLTSVLSDARKSMRNGDFEAAFEHLDEHKNRMDDSAEFLTLMGIAAIRAENLAYSIQLFERAQELPRASSDIPEVLAVLYALAGNLTESLYQAKLGTVKKLDNRVLGLLRPGLPGFATVFTKIKDRPLLAAGESFYAESRFPEAIDKFSQHVTLYPKDNDGYDGLSRALLAGMDPITAVDVIRSLRTISPDDADYAGRLGRALSHSGEYAQAEACYRQALELDGENFEVRRAFLRDLAYAPKSTTELRETLQRDMTRLVISKASKSAAAPERQPRPEKLRVGYLVGGLPGADESTMVSEITRHHDRNRFSLVGFGYGDIALPHNRPFQMRFDRWVNIRRINEQTFTSMIRGEGVDILIDLGGELAPEHIRAIPSHAAALQVSLPIGPTHFAIPGIDVTIVAPAESSRTKGDRDKSWPMDTGRYTFRCPETAEPTSQCPYEVNGNISFGVDATLAELNPNFVMVLCQIASRVPGSMLLLRDHARQHPKYTQRIIESFGNFGMAHRVDLISATNRQDFLLEIDIQLIPFPYARPFSAAESIWRGVPVVTLNRPGQACQDVAHFLSRLEGIDGMIADTENDYVEHAVAWAKDPQRLTSFRSDGWRIANACPAFRPAKFTAALEDTLDAIWNSKTAGRSPVV